VTRLARGKSRSLPLNEIIKEIQGLHEAGTPEVVLSGVNLGAWGRDFESKSDLASLINTILKQTDIQRIRLSSLEPWNIGEEFFAMWENPRLCRHFHLPLQSGSDTVLKRMGRRITTDKFLSLTQAAQQMIPDLALTTDVIVGFPGEMDEEFAQSLEFVQKIGFSAGHVFRYSERPGTPATRLDGLIEKSIKKERSRIMRGAFKRMGEAFLQEQVGKNFSVLWESATMLENGNWLCSGLTDTYLRIKMEHNTDLSGQIQTIYMLNLQNKMLLGKIVPDGD
jgi:threonylcarbamoyladenosine tRNA methylthiotransferase MtaB